jgi:fatty acid desaturase
MIDHRAPELDMLPDGTFRQPARPPVATRVFFWAVLIASVAGALALAAFALWIAVIILPVALGAAAVAWLAFRFQLWRAGGSFDRRPVDRGPGDVWRR